MHEVSWASAPERGNLFEGKMRNQIFRALSAIAISVLVGAPNAKAADLFDITVRVGDIVDTRSFNSFSDLLQIAEDGAYEQINAAYQEGQAAFAELNLRGLGAEITYAGAGSDLELSIPGIDFARTFTGETRAQSEAALEAFLKNNSDELLTDILNELAASTAVDPVAGNPSSLQARLIDAAFSMGSSVGADLGARTEVEIGPVGSQSLFGFGAKAGRYTADEFEMDVVNVPLSYKMPLTDAGTILSFSLPLTYMKTEDAATYSASFGVGLQLPVTSNWSLTPAIRAGATGSADLGAAGVMYTGSLTSSLRFALGSATLELGNMGAIVQTLPNPSVDGYSVEYDLTNFVTRNGLSISTPLPFDAIGSPLALEVSATNTQLFGDDLFIENYTDVAASIGTTGRGGPLSWDGGSLGVTYTFSDEDFQGLKLNFGYQF